MIERLLNYDRTVERGAKLKGTISPDYRWTTFEVFCDGYLVYQQTLQGVQINAQVSPLYLPVEMVIAFDGQVVFALRGNEVSLNRLSQPIVSYSPEVLRHV